jgi:hypothetical protein
MVAEPIHLALANKPRVVEMQGVAQVHRRAQVAASESPKACSRMGSKPPGNAPEACAHASHESCSGCSRSLRVAVATLLSGAPDSDVGRARCPVWIGLPLADPKPKARDSGFAVLVHLPLSLVLSPDGRGNFEEGKWNGRRGNGTVNFRDRPPRFTRPRKGPTGGGARVCALLRTRLP